MKNNNREVIRLLAGKLYASDSRRNHILAGAAAVSFFLLFSIFSIVVGRINAEKLRFTRMAGTAATTFLEDATMEQAEQIMELDYIQDVGMEYIFGGIYRGEKEIGARVYVDKTTFDLMLRPAYTKIYGEYPKEKEEVMLARRTLEGMGIKEPNVGMGIKLITEGGREEEFILSGFYTEFMGEEQSPYGFFSKRYYEKAGNSTGQAAVLAIRQKDWYDGEGIENMLYRDIPTIDRAQQFIGGDSISYTTVLELVGGLDIGICSALLIILCASMLIYNVTALSLCRDVRQYGLLKTLGTTSWQTVRIILRQIARVLFIGMAAGMAAGGVFVFGVLPRVLEGRYLEGFGEASAIISFHPFLLLGAVLLTAGSTLFSSFIPIWKVGRMAPASSLYYLGGISGTGRKEQKSGRGNQIALMAWRNMFRNRKSAIITLGSLFLGLLTALAAMVLVQGMDYRNKIEQDDDFELSVANAPFLSDGYQEPRLCFDSSFLGQISALDGIREIKRSAGGYLALDSGDTVWQPLLEGSRMGEGMQDNEQDRQHAGHVRKYYMAGYTVVDEAYIDALEKCCSEHGLSLDIEGLREGTSAVAFHFNELSRQLEEESVSYIGESFSLRTFAGKELGEVKFGGYLKRNQKGLPPCETEASTSGYPTLLISRKCLRRLGLYEKIFALNINVDEKMEAEVKYQLNNMLERLRKTYEAQEGEVGAGFFMVSKSDIIASAESELLTVRILMYTVSSLLACMGVFQYFNVTVSSLEARKKEFMVLESLGMTRKQLLRMLVLEGLYYSTLTAAFLVTAGSGVLWLVYCLGKQRVPYMQFYYPAAGLLIMLVLVYAGCICLPLWMLRRKPAV